jgi:hypothetical protein
LVSSGVRLAARTPLGREELDMMKEEIRGEEEG